jgi:hypothetical protein
MMCAEAVGAVPAFRRSTVRHLSGFVLRRRMHILSIPATVVTMRFKIGLIGLRLLGVILISWPPRFSGVTEPGSKGEHGNCLSYINRFKRL